MYYIFFYKSKPNFDPKVMQDGIIAAKVFFF